MHNINGVEEISWTGGGRSGNVGSDYILFLVRRGKMGKKLNFRDLLRQME